MDLRLTLLSSLPAGLQVYRPSSEKEILDSLRLLVTEQQEWEKEVVTSTNIYKQRVFHNSYVYVTIPFKGGGNIKETGAELDLF